MQTSRYLYSITQEHDLPRNIQRLLRVRRNLCRSADFASTFLSLHTTPKANLLVQNELPDDLHPAVVARQVAVELVRNLVQLPKPSPRNSREVVVLVVQTDVVREQIQHAVVRESLRRRRKLGFLALLVGLLQRARVLCEDVVLGDEVASDGVQRAGEEGAQDEITERFAANVLHEEVVYRELHEDVESVDARERQVVNHHGTEGVEEDLEGCEESFAGDGVEEPGFEGSGKVGVEAVHAEGLVVGQVVRLDMIVRRTVQHDCKCTYRHTLNEAEYGMPIGKLAKIASMRFANGDLKARLCEIS